MADLTPLTFWCPFCDASMYIRVNETGTPNLTADEADVQACRDHYESHTEAMVNG